MKLNKLYLYFRGFCAKVSKHLFSQLTRDKLRFKWNYVEWYGFYNFLRYAAKCYLNSLRPQKYEINLAITAIAKNEAPYIREWIEFHRLVGVEKFFIYDNESTDNLKEVLKPYIESGIVEYTYFPGRCRQFPAYRDSIARNANRVKFMAIIDCDEFITPIKHNTIPEFIEYLEQKIKHKIDAVGINWIMHGYNGHYDKQEGLVCENYSKCDFNFCIYKNFAKIVNANGEDMYGPFCHPYIEDIRINHYWSKSYSEMLQKFNRGMADNNNKYQEVPYEPNYLSIDEDHSMDRFIPILKEKLKIN